MGAVLNQAIRRPATRSPTAARSARNGLRWISRSASKDRSTAGRSSSRIPYGIVAVNPGVHEHVNYDLAMAYIGFVTSHDGQAIIEEFTVDGERLFFPESLSTDPNFGQYVPEGWTPERRES